MQEYYVDSSTQASFPNVNHLEEDHDLHFFPLLEQLCAKVYSAKPHAMESSTEMDCANCTLSHSPASCTVYIQLYIHFPVSILYNKKTQRHSIIRHNRKKKSERKPSASLNDSYCTHQWESGQLLVIALCYFSENKKLTGSNTVNRFFSPKEGYDSLYLSGKDQFSMNKPGILEDKYKYSSV